MTNVNTQTTCCCCMVQKQHTDLSCLLLVPLSQKIAEVSLVIHFYPDKTTFFWGTDVIVSTPFCLLFFTAFIGDG